MEILHLPDGRPVVARLDELYRPDEHACTLGYRRLLGVIRLAHVIEDQLGVDAERAVLLAATALGIVRRRRQPADLVHRSG